MYTKHGHQIPGTTVSYPKPGVVVQCGGLMPCFKCWGEAWRATLIKVTPERELPKVSLMDKLAMELRARTIVGNYFNEHREDPMEIPDITLKEIHIVWFAKTLKNWKACVTTDVPDNTYYEVTYDGNAQEIYLDVYVKKENVVIPI